MDNCTYSMTYRLILLVALLLPNAAHAQEGREGATFLLFGFGGSNQMDTYLSPMEYDGWQASVLTGRERMTRMAGGRISFQSMMQAAATRTENPARTAEMWGGRIAYDAAWHWNWTPAKGLRLKAGAQVGTDLGFLYNNRNGNSNGKHCRKGNYEPFFRLSFFLYRRSRHNAATSVHEKSFFDDCIFYHTTSCITTIFC